MIYFRCVDWSCVAVMDHKYKALLQNIPTRHVITAIAPMAERESQIEKLRNLDINNFFILGSLQSIKAVLGNALYIICRLTFEAQWQIEPANRSNVLTFRGLQTRVFRKEFRLACNHVVQRRHYLQL